MRAAIRKFFAGYGAAHKTTEKFFNDAEKAFDDAFLRLGYYAVSEPPKGMTAEEVQELYNLFLTYETARNSAIYAQSEKNDVVRYFDLAVNKTDRFP